MTERWIQDSAWTPIGNGTEVWHNLGRQATLGEVLRLAQQPARRATDWPRAMVRTDAERRGFRWITSVERVSCGWVAVHVHGDGQRVEHYTRWRWQAQRAADRMHRSCREA